MNSHGVVAAVSQLSHKLRDWGAEDRIFKKMEDNNNLQNNFLISIHYTYHETISISSNFLPSSAMFKKSVPGLRVWSGSPERSQVPRQHCSLRWTGAVKSITVAGEGSTIVQISQCFWKQLPLSVSFPLHWWPSHFRREVWRAIYSLRIRLWSALFNSRKKQDTIQKIGQSDNVVALGGVSGCAITSARETPGGISAPPAEVNWCFAFSPGLKSAETIL